MHLPFKYDDLLNDDFGLGTNSTTTREVNKEDIIDTDTLIESIDTMCDYPSSQFLSEILNSEEDSEMFSRTYFDDIATEVDLTDTYDSLFANTIPRQWFSPSCFNTDVFIMNEHDCMWGGICASNVHKDDLDTAAHKIFSGLLAPHVLCGPPVARPQQSLLKPNLRNAGVPVINMITPQTPPMSDSDGEIKNDDLRIPRIGGSESDDDELPSYFASRYVSYDDDEDEQEEASQQSSSESSSSSSSDDSSDDERQPQPGPSRLMPNASSVRCNLRATQNDHSYHKDKNSSMLSDLGIDTPSDSEEEEIDVVSVSDKKYPVGTRMGYIPPTNPPNGARRIIHRPAESARIHGRNNNRNGVKVMLPAKRSHPSSNNNNYPAAKRIAMSPVVENRGRKPRQTRTNQSTGRRKRSNDSEDDHPPMEKRSLHNDMERQRRVDLRKAFEDLRRTVPEVARKERAAKVVILKETSRFCSDLVDDADNFVDETDELMLYQQERIRKLSLLRTEMAKMEGRAF